MIYIDRCYSLSFENRHLSSLVSLDRCFETVKKIMNTHRPSLSLHKYIKWCGVFVYVAQRSSKCEKGKKRLNQLSISNGAVNRATERNLCTHVTHSSKEDETWKRRATKKDCRNEEEETLADMCHTYFPPNAPRYTSFWWKMIRNCQAFDTDGIFSEGILTHSSTFYYQQIKPFSAWFVVYVWFLFALGLSQSSGLTLVFFFGVKITLIC